MSVAIRQVGRDRAVEPDFARLGKWVHTHTMGFGSRRS
jgi:hypothetical protein